MKKLRMLVGSVALLAWIFWFVSVFGFFVAQGLLTWNILYFLLATVVFFFDYFAGNIYVYPKIVEWVEKE